jgi:hypothetical protein
MWIDVEPRTFVARFNRTAFLLRHHLATHPLLEPDRLKALARRLPPALLELNAGDVPVGLTTPAPRRGLTAEEALDRIGDCNTWVGLKQITYVPEYRALVDEVLDELRPYVDRREPGMHTREGFIFVSSPQTVVPFHVDPEHNFLLQIRGRKTLSTYDKMDRAVLTERHLERHYGENQRKLDLQYQNGRVEEHLLGPGDALHVPVSAPHHVRTHDEVSVSLSITFRTRAGDRRARLYRFNHLLRGFGVVPRPVGESPLYDRLRYGLYAAGRSLSYICG